MTNLERLISFLGFSPSENAAEGALMDLNVDKDAVYVTANLVQIKTAALEVMKVLITTADFGNAMTGAQTKYDRQSIIARIKALENELGLTASGPTIRAVNVW